MVETKKQGAREQKRARLEALPDEFLHTPTKARRCHSLQLRGHGSSREGYCCGCLGQPDHNIVCFSARTLHIKIPVLGQNASSSDRKAMLPSRSAGR